MDRPQSSKGRSRYRTPLPFDFPLEDSLPKGLADRTRIDGHGKRASPVTLFQHDSPSAERCFGPEMSDKTKTSPDRGRHLGLSTISQAALGYDLSSSYPRTEHTVGSEGAVIQPNSSSPEFDSHDHSTGSSITRKSKTDSSDTSISPNQHNKIEPRHSRYESNTAEPIAGEEEKTPSLSRLTSWQAKAHLGSPQGWTGPEPSFQGSQVALLQVLSKPASTGYHGSTVEKPKPMKRPPHHFSRPTSRKAQGIPPLPFEKEVRKAKQRARSIPAHHENRTRRYFPQRSPSVSSVRYEEVEGVTMDSQPNDYSERQSGLAIPEIEARDIRQIIDLPSASEDDNFDDRQRISHRPHYAQPPPSCASHTSIRAISPRPPTHGQDHCFVDRYSRAMEKDSLDPKGHSLRDDTNPNLEIDPELEFETNPEVVRRAVDTYEGGAEPPTVRRTTAFQEQDDRMTSHTQKAKHMMRNMLKGLSLPGFHRHDSGSSENSEAHGAHPVTKGGSSNDQPFTYRNSSEEESGADAAYAWPLNTVDRSGNGSRLSSTHGTGEHPLYLDDSTSLDTPRTTVYIGNGSW